VSLPKISRSSFGTFRLYRKLPLGRRKTYLGSLGIASSIAALSESASPEASPNARQSLTHQRAISTKRSLKRSQKWSTRTFFGMLVFLPNEGGQKTALMAGTVTENLTCIYSIKNKHLRTNLHRSNEPISASTDTKKPPQHVAKGGFLWCPGEDSNLHVFWTLVPETSASTIPPPGHRCW
jgi:hypothetical protein